MADPSARPAARTVTPQRGRTEAEPAGAAHRSAVADPLGEAVALRAESPLDIRHVVVQPPVSHPSRANGLHNVVRRLAVEQQAAGDQVRLRMLAGDSDFADQTSGSVPSAHLPLRGPSMAGRPLLVGRATLARLLEGAGPRTIVHLHGAVKPVFTVLGHHLRRHGVPYGVTLHGQYSHVFDINGSARRRLSSAYLRLIDRHVLSHARFVQAITPEEEAIVRYVAPAARVRQLPNAAYSVLSDGLPRQVARPAPDVSPLTFGFCARYEIEHKGVDLLIDGFAAYRRSGGRGALELIGTGPARSAIETRIENAGISPFVRVHGPRFGPDKAEIMGRWHYFVLASRFDVMPTGCRAAARTGLPLIVTRETGLASMAQRSGAGLAIPSLSPAAVADALLRADSLTTDEWRGMAAGAHEMACGIGDWGEIAARLRDFYTAP